MNITPDPNWLLSSVVQSAAAFVAIVAGFIVSRLLALSSERNGLLKSIADLELQLRDKIGRLDSLKTTHLELDVNDFLGNNKVWDKILKTEGDVPLSEAIRLTNVPRTEKELQPYWQERISTVKRAFTIIREKWGELTDDCLVNIASLLASIGIDDIHSKEADIYYRVFLTLYKTMPLKKVTKRNTTQDFINYRDLDIPLPSASDKAAEIARNEALATEKRNRYSALQKDIELLQYETTSIENQILHLEQQLKSYGNPQGVRSGLGILIYITITGVIAPLFVLPLSVTNFTPLLKWAIILSFSIGLVLFFWWIIKLVRSLQM